MKRPAAPGKRILIVSAFIAGVYLLLFGRIVFLQTVRASEFRAKASEAHKTEDKLKPIRGRILDCNGIVLARTIEESTVTLYPVKIANTALAAEIVSRHTGIPEQRVLAELKSGKSPNILVRHLPREVAERLHSDLLYRKTGKRWTSWPEGWLNGVAVKSVVRREYPLGPVGANVVGILNSEGKAISGVEKDLDSELRGRPGSIRGMFDRHGEPILTLIKSRTPAVPGQDIVLTLDSRIQAAAEEAVKKQVQQHRARSGQCVVLDIKTGAIRAIAEYPSFDRAVPDRRSLDLLVPVSLSQVYEPGSTAKLVTAVTALSHRLGNVTCQCTGTIYVGKHRQQRVNCPCAARFREPGQPVTIAGMLKYSCNSEAWALARRMGAEALYEGYKNFRLFEPIELPGYGVTKPGLLPTRENRDQMWTVTASFGQGIATTRLHLTRAFAAVANGGRMMQPMLVSETRSPEGDVIKKYTPRAIATVASPEHCATVMQYLVEGVKDGTGKSAQVNGFTIAGKTGSAQVFDKNGVVPGAFISSFAGIAPADDPANAILVSVERPKGSTHGSVVAAPAFKEVAKMALWCAGKVSRNPVQPAPAPRRATNVSERRVAGGHT